MRKRPFVVRVTWPSRRFLTFGFRDKERATEYAEAVGKRGARVELRDDLTGELILETGERLQFQFIPREGFEPAGVRPGTIPGIGRFTLGLADCPGEWVAPDGRIVLGGFVRFTGTQPGGTTLGGSSLIYRLTVAGADKASIDTGVDAPDAGSNDWTNGDLLEVH